MAARKNITRIPAVDRILDRVLVHADGCWEFTGATTAGYGMVMLGRGVGTARAHRVVYEDCVGPIPAGMTLDHLCHNTRCVNPGHLEPTTRRENTLRQWAAGRSNAGAANRAKTHCKHGHPFDGANTYHYDRQRRCRACSRENARRYAARRKEALP
jgi:hypothetical protein